MSLLTSIFNFLGIGIFNTVPPTIANAQASPFQCDANGRLLVTIAGITSGAPPLALPVNTTGRIITTPGVSNGYQVSAPFNSSAGLPFTQIMPTSPIRGMRVLVTDSGGFASVTPSALFDSNGYKIQNPLSPTVITTTYSFNQSGFSALWEFITGDPTNGSFWAAVRSLQ